MSNSQTVINEREKEEIRIIIEGIILEEFIADEVMLRQIARRAVEKGFRTTPPIKIFSDTVTKMTRKLITQVNSNTKINELKANSDYEEIHYLAWCEVGKKCATCVSESLLNLVSTCGNYCVRT